MQIIKQKYIKLSEKIDGKRAERSPRCNIIPDSWMISYRSKFKKNWDSFILILAIYNSLVIPLDQALKPLWLKHSTIPYINYFIDFMFLLDIIITFFTSIMTRQGYESWNAGDVAVEYITQSRFYIDTLSLLGSDLLRFIHRYFALFGMLKIVRVLRIGSMIKAMTVDKEKKAVFNLLKLIFYLFLYLHLVACYYWITINFNTGTKYYIDMENDRYISSEDEIFMQDGQVVRADPTYEIMYGPHPTFLSSSWNRWTPSESADWESLNANWDSREMQYYMPLNWANFVDQTIFTKEYSFWFRYKTMLYLALMMLGSNEMGPVNEVEMVFATVNMIVAALLNTFLFGDIANLISVLERKNVQWQDTLDGANFVMSKIEMNSEEQD
jgi:hypothetical protein